MRAELREGFKPWLERFCDFSILTFPAQPVERAYASRASIGMRRIRSRTDKAAAPADTGYSSLRYHTVVTTSAMPEPGTVALLVVAGGRTPGDAPAGPGEV